jgi:hypothetical protein
MSNTIDVTVPVNANVQKTVKKTVAEVVAEVELSAVETEYLNGATAGGNVASKCKVNDANGNQGVVKATQLHIGASGSETQVTATAAQLNRTAVTTPGTQEASKVACADANGNVGVVKATQLHIGATGAEVQVTATPAEINSQCAVASIGQTITDAGAQVVTAGKKSVLLNNAAATIAATIADASLHFGWFTVKAGLEPAGGQDHTCTITTGTWDGTNKIATFADINDALVVFFDHAGNGTIISNTGAVALS